MSYSYQSIPEISVEELALKLADKDSSLQLIDVREKHEAEIAFIAGFNLLPLSQFSEWSEQILVDFNPEAETLVMCHHGMRSAQMCQWLIQNGFTNVKNVAGGIDIYSCLIDSSIPRY
ncbi:MAG: rhodanese-like domain-containing protein [Xenococcaceae cyanobacterium]